MILHLLTDDKFTDYVINQFEAPEMQSEFVVIPSNDSLELVKQIDKCTVIRQRSAEYEQLVARQNQYSGVVFHGMFFARWQRPLLERMPESVKVAWFFWGGEIYTRHGMEEYFLAPITRWLYRLHNWKNNYKPVTYWEIPLELYKRVDYCLTSEHEEYEFAKKYTGANFKHLWYTCYSIEETVGPLMESRCAGNNIWLGNSAAMENNHVDVLWMLWKSRLLRRLKGEKVIIPLSYGNPWVKNAVKRVGRLALGRRMQALESYMPRNEYNQLMLSCSTMIIGYWEPAAQGNIITALWLGMRVYLSEKSIAYAFFKRIGANVYSIESDLKKYQFTPISEEEFSENREVMKKWYSKEHVKQAVNNVVDELR